MQLLSHSHNVIFGTHGFCLPLISFGTESQKQRHVSLDARDEERGRQWKREGEHGKVTTQTPSASDVVSPFGAEKGICFTHSQSAPSLTFSAGEKGCAVFFCLTSALDATLASAFTSAFSCQTPYPATCPGIRSRDHLSRPTGTPFSRRRQTIAIRHMDHINGTRVLAPYEAPSRRRCRCSPPDFARRLQQQQSIKHSIQSIVNRGFSLAK